MLEIHERFQEVQEGVVWGAVEVCTTGWESLLGGAGEVCFDVQGRYDVGITREMCAGV